jgi:hypothetical protein
LVLAFAIPALYPISPSSATEGSRYMLEAFDEHALSTVVPPGRAHRSGGAAHGGGGLR